MLSPIFISIRTVIALRAIYARIVSTCVAFSCVSNARARTKNVTHIM
eukprot:UN03183